MSEPRSSGAPMSPRSRVRAGQALFRERASEIVAVVVRRAEAGDRGAMRLARRYGLPVGPTPEALAARLAESIARTRATITALLADGGITLGSDSRLRYARRKPGPAHRSGARVIALCDVKTRRRAGGALPQCNGRGGGACK